MSQGGFEPPASRFGIPQRDDLTTNRQGRDAILLSSNVSIAAPPPCELWGEIVCCAGVNCANGLR